MIETCLKSDRKVDESVRNWATRCYLKAFKGLERGLERLGDLCQLQLLDVRENFLGPSPGAAT